MTGTVYYANLTDADDELQRIVYGPEGRTGEIVSIQQRRRNFGGILTLRLRGTF